MLLQEYLWDYEGGIKEQAVKGAILLYPKHSTTLARKEK